jgi:REP element-mobilizing transposase RayT
MIMPRQARKLSSTNIYHIMLRGMNGMQIFLDAEDNLKFLEVLKECRDISGFQLYAYCLMGNHVHILLRADGEDTGMIFKRLGARYVHWYNSKYDRIGYLFQGRYKSEPVENDSYLLTVARYIHLNPVHARLASDINDYVWSSYGEYTGARDIVDTSYIMDIVNMEEFLRIHQDLYGGDNEQNPFGSRMPDGKAREVIERISGCTTGAQFQGLEAGQRRAARRVRYMLAEGGHL